MCKMHNVHAKCTMCVHVSLACHQQSSCLHVGVGTNVGAVRQPDTHKVERGFEELVMSKVKDGEDVQLDMVSNVTSSGVLGEEYCKGWRSSMNEVLQGILNGFPITEDELHTLIQKAESVIKDSMQKRAGVDDEVVKFLTKKWVQKRSEERRNGRGRTTTKGKEPEETQGMSPSHA